MTSSLPKFELLQVLTALVILCSWGCRPGVKQTPKGPPLKLSLAMQPTPYSGLIAIADEKGYFKAAGLEVSLAEDLALTNEEEAKRILARKWAINPALLQETWPRTRLNVSFGQSVVTSLQSYTLWQ